MYVVVFVAAQVLLLLFLIVTGATGIAGAAVAAQTGRAEAVARTMLGAVFINALAASLVLGFGMTQVFSEATLRRYPLSRGERLAASHLLPLLEPLWLVALALYAGVALGFWAFGVAPLWLSVPAVLLLAAANFLLVRALVSLTDRAMASRSGQFVVIVVFNVLAFLPMLLGALARGRPDIAESLSRTLDALPHAAAAGLLAGSALAWNGALLTVWATALGGLLMVLERYPVASRSSTGGTSWVEGPVDRLAAMAPRGCGPVVSKTLGITCASPACR